MDNPLNVTARAVLICCCTGPFGMRICQKLRRVLMGSPPPSCPIKVSPLRLLLQTSTNHQVRATETIPISAQRSTIMYFPSLYHKYINYANYEHCILTKTHFLSFSLLCAKSKFRLLYSTYRVKCSLFSVIPRSYKGPCHCLCQSRIIKNSSQLADWR